MTRPDTTQPPHEPSVLNRITRATVGAGIAALAGLVVVAIVGMIAWDAVYGFNGAIIAAVVGALLGGALRGFGDWSGRSLGGAVGGAVGGFFAVAAAEQSRPGGTEWAVRGVLVGAVLSVPVAAVVAAAVAAVGALIRTRA